MRFGSSSAKSCRWRLALAWLLCFAPAAPGAHAQTCPSVAGIVGPAATEHDLIFRVVRYLADEALEGRRPGEWGERCAGDFIAAEFERLGLAPGGDEGTFFQHVPLLTAAGHASLGTGRNVIGILPGGDPALRVEAVVIGAHYDHLGRDTTFSLARGAGNAIHHGADDNASGVAALLGVAEGMLERARPARSLVFIAFTGEELGLLGSSHYVREPVIPLERTRAMLNLDMVGRLGTAPLLVYGTGTAEEWDDILRDAAAAEGLPIGTQPDGYGASDHTVFYVRDVPVLHFFSNAHSDYHRPSDTWDRIDFDGLRRITALVTRITGQLADHPLGVTLVRGAGGRAVLSPSSGAGAFLGTIPDYMPVAGGVRLSGVSPDSPAEAAGLRAGDVIIRFGEQPIPDLYLFTEALRARRPGDPLRITVIRDGREVILDAVLGSRSAP